MTLTLRAPLYNRTNRKSMFARFARRRLTRRNRTNPGTRRLVVGATTVLGVLAIVLLVGRWSSSGPVTLTIDSSERHQTWEGWEVTINKSHRSDNALSDLDRHPVDQWILDEMVADAADNLGITAIDLTIPIVDNERYSIEPVNDNPDPELDPGGFRQAATSRS